MSRLLQLHEGLALFERRGESLGLVIADDVDPDRIAGLPAVERVTHGPGTLDRLAVDRCHDVADAESRLGGGAAFLDLLHHDTTVLGGAEELAQLGRDVEGREAEVDAAEQIALVGEDLPVPDDDRATRIGGIGEQGRGSEQQHGYGNLANHWILLST